MELPHIGKFVFHNTWLKVEGVGHRMEDIDKMDDHDIVRVFCTDGQWYEIERVNLFLFKDACTDEEKKYFNYKRFLEMDE